MNTELKELTLGCVRPSKTNPRKDFTSAGAVAYLADMAATIEQHGVKQPALVRPGYCVGARTRSELEQRRSAEVEWYELVFGECRWRASGVARRETLPCLVEELTDDDAREVQQIENLQRRDLTVMEEARGIGDMLSLTNDAGEPRYTVETLAQRLGRKVAWVYARKELLALPEEAQAALDAGLLTPSVARLFAPLPSSTRVEFARRVLHPEFEGEPLSLVAAKELRDREYVKVLKGVPFDLEDATLLPEAGACAACPRMSANCAHLIEGDDAHLKQRACLDPACYRRKLDALQARQAAAAAAEGKRMLPAEEAQKVYPYYTQDGEMDPRSPYVQIDARPPAHLLKSEVGKVPTWRELVTEAEEKTGVKVERVMIADQCGVQREHVDTKLAMAAIEKAGEPIFRAAGEAAPKGSADAFALDKKAEQDRAKLQWVVTKAALDAVWAALTAESQRQTESARGAAWQGKPEAVEAMLDAAIELAGEAGAGVLLRWQGREADGDAFGAVRDWFLELSRGVEKNAAFALLLFSFEVKQHGSSAANFTAFARAVGVDLGAVGKKAIADHKAKEKGARLKPAELEDKVRELLRTKETPAGIAVKLGLSLRKVDQVMQRIEEKDKGPRTKDQGPRAGAEKVTTDAKTLAEWVRARAAGMSVVGIAKSYKVSVSDVEGALEEHSKQSAGREPAAGQVQAVRTLLAANRSTASIAIQLKLSLPTVERLKREIAAEEKPNEKDQGQKTKDQGQNARKGKKPVMTAAEREQEVRRLRAQGKNFAEIFMATKYPRTKLPKLLEQIDAEKGGRK